MMDAWGYAAVFARDDGSGGMDNGMVMGNEFGGSDFSFGNANSSRSAIINEFRFQTSKSIRTSTIILASFNVLAAFATAVGIIWDNYSTKKRNDPLFKLRTSGFTFVSSPDTFPLVLSFGIVIQGLVFAAAQSTGLSGMFTLGCTTTSQFMLPAVFIVPYIQLLFGLESSFRAIRKEAFAPRGKWTVTGTLVFLGAILLATFLVSHFIQPPSFCFPSLFWFVQRWKKGIFVAFIVIAALLFISSVIIFARLHSCCSVDITERIAASRLVYYLAIGIIPIALTIPFFYTLVFSDLRSAGQKPLNFSMIASVVVNLSGLTTGGLHLLLRANCLSPIGAAGKCEQVRKLQLKGDIRVSPGGRYEDMDSASYRSRRLDGTFSPRMEKEIEEEEERVQSPAGTPTYESSNPMRLNALPLASPRLDMPNFPESPRPSRIEALKTQIRKSSYSIFPRENNTKSFGLLPATTYTPSGASMTSMPGEDDDMSNLVPPPLVFGGGVRHRRTSSIGSHLSHATVQIGIRFSNAEEAPRIDSRYMSKVHDLGCPLESDKGKRPSPLATSGSDTEDDDGTLVNSLRDSSRLLERKALPFTPGLHEEPLTLSAAVYTPGNSTPVARVTSPKGVGFSDPPKRSSSPKAKPRCYKDNCTCDGLHRGQWI
ncbi:hypothetical protein B0T11DRAFT_328311 [Plectosphaerella cucumerina]|uniref:Uncharacterized protein n=1 Tax=Plectosphaerella cucumerina TaxID=40658 RepID=A0A8K0TF01_9PEZI|nr:hypothetical protein B0T11DRAFT_328311 [Plectosphaerella cucumerina]